MKLTREKSIREKTDEPTRKMIDLWHKLCKENYGETYEVLLGNRHDHKQLKEFKGELNTAFPGHVKGKNVIVIWLEQLKAVDFVMITHELGHFVLHLSNFDTYTYKKTEQSNIEILLNSMAHHPALYNLQRSLGHKPQYIIDDRAKDNIEKFSKTPEPDIKNLWIENALLLSDDIINSSKILNEKLKRIISSNHPKTFNYIDKILSLTPYYDLFKPHRNIRFMKKVIDVLDIDKGWWDKRDGIIALRKHFSKSKY